MKHCFLNNSDSAVKDGEVMR